MVRISDRRRSDLGGRGPLEFIQPIRSVPDKTLSTKLRAMHSNVRMSKPGGRDIMPANIICPSHFGHGGRSIPVRPGSSEMSGCGMMRPLELGGERDTFLATGR
jgi:hypothetical protein